MAEAGVAGAQDQAAIYAWDFVFDDNFGFYRLHFLLRRGSGLPGGDVIS